MLIPPDYTSETDELIPLYLAQAQWLRRSESPDPGFGHTTRDVFKRSDGERYAPILRGSDGTSMRIEFFSDRSINLDR